MTDELTPAQRFDANLGLTSPAPKQAPEASAPAGQPVVAPWGTMHTDPQEALDALNARPDFQAALFDASNPGHKSAIAARSRIFAQLYGAERGDKLAGDGSGNMNPAIHEGYQEPTEAEMRAAYTNTATGILERQGVDGETAKDLAELAVGAGLSTLDVSEVTQAIANSSRQYSSPEEVRAALGADAPRLIAAAQAEADRLKLPAELLDMELASGICLGEHPAVVRQLARRAGVR